jgi:hypothetical protein
VARASEGKVLGAWPEVSLVWAAAQPDKGAMEWGALGLAALGQEPPEPQVGWQAWVQWRGPVAVSVAAEALEGRHRSGR